MRTLSLCIVFLLLTLAGCGSGSDGPDAGESEEMMDASDSEESEVPELLDFLNGAWKSTQDPNVIVQFENGRFFESYDGEILTDEPVRQVETCPGNPAGSGGEYFLVGTDFCYVVVSVTDTALSYSMIGGRGNTLTFKRTEDVSLSEPQGEPRSEDALFGESVCKALRPAVLTGNIRNLEKYASADVLQILSADAKQGFPPDEEDVSVWPNDDMTCSISMPGDAWFELSLMGDGHVGHRAVSVAIRTSYDE